MTNRKEIDEKNLLCNDFEDFLSDYLDGNLEREMRVAMAEHALRCPMCHALLNTVKSNLEICHEIPTPKFSATRLEARILNMTMPETAMSCGDFEESLTDYLDGFLVATQFHRWERHAMLCTNCSDLPGMVVRSIGACYTYKNEELPIPAGLHNKILQATLGTTNVHELKPSRINQIIETIRQWNFPISIPQLAPVAMMLLFAVLFLSQTVSADGLSGVYRTSFQMAQQTYQQGAETVYIGFNGKNETDVAPKHNTDPPIEPTFVTEEDK